MQRSLDVVLALAALVVLAPLLVPVIVILRLTGEGEIFYVQQRVGLGGEFFGLLKFATMLKNSPNMGTGTVTVKNDPRILPVGRFLRGTKINELPQLLNVLLGHMSIVGPRPQTQRCFNGFPPKSQARIVQVRPGLSGVGSIIFRGEESMLEASRGAEGFYDDVIMPYKGLLEEWYVQNSGIATYLKCIVVTIWVVLLPHSQLPWRSFKGLPEPPNELRGFLCPTAGKGGGGA